MGVKRMDSSDNTRDVDRSKENDIVGKSQNTRFLRGYQV